MLSKKNIVTTLLLLSSTSVFANDDNNFKFYGNLKGDIGDIDYVDNADRFYGSYLGISFDGLVRDNFTYKLNLGVSHTTDLMKEVPDFDNDDFEFDINEALIRYHHNDDFTLDFGRFFTPIGFYNEDPLAYNNLFDGSSTTNRYTDGFKTTYLTNKNDLDLRVDGFIGVRLDNSFVSSLYGINFDIGNDNIGHFAAGYMYTSLPGKLFIKGFQGSLEASDGHDTFIGYLYESDQFSGTLTYHSVEFDKVLKNQITYAQLRYKTKIIEPYVEYEHNYLTLGDKSSSFNEATMDTYLIGAQLNYSDNLSFYGEGAYLDPKESDNSEEVYNIGLKFEY
jgi:hypothetical protein